MSSARLQHSSTNLARDSSRKGAKSGRIGLAERAELNQQKAERLKPSAGIGCLRCRTRNRAIAPDDLAGEIEAIDEPISSNIEKRLNSGDGARQWSIRSNLKLAPGSFVPLAQPGRARRVLVLHHPPYVTEGDQVGSRGRPCRNAINSAGLARSGGPQELEKHKVFFFSSLLVLQRPRQERPHPCGDSCGLRRPGLAEAPSCLAQPRRHTREQVASEGGLRPTIPWLICGAAATACAVPPQGPGGPPPPEGADLQERIEAA